MSKTVMEVLDATVKQHASRAAWKVKRDGSWTATSWEEVREGARQVARSLIALGVKPKTGVSIVGFNSPEWVLADVGAILAGAMPAGIYTTNSAEQCRYVAHHSESAVAFAENATQAKKFVQMRAELPYLKKVVQWSGDVVDAAGWVISWRDFIELGKRVRETDADERIAAQKPDDPCTLIYTSGTTGDPKAVMISHKNLTFVSDVCADVNQFGPDDQTISYLPLSHVAEQVLSIHLPMRMGSTVWFAESLEKVPENLREVRPTAFFGVPRVWEKMQAKMAAALESAPPLRKRIARWARNNGLRASLAEQHGGRKPMLLPLADAIVFSKVKERLGFDRCRFFATSAAPISRDTLDFFASLGMILCEVYGMSECTGPTTISTPDRYRTGKVGWVMPGTELKIEKDGEICMRGPHVFLGYFKDPASTKEALDEDGWLHSGDIGTLEDGYVQITDRKKELLITAGGENIAPQVIEGHLKSIPVVAQAVVIGDRMKFLTALVALDPERVIAEAQEAGSSARDVKSAAKDPVFRAHLEKQIEGVNAKLARVQTIKKFVVLENELTIEGGELTPTMKLRRRVINAKYKDSIDGMYAGAE